MEKASVSDLHLRTSELVRAVSEGAVIVIERHGEPVAELRPVKKKNTGKTRKDWEKLRAKVFAEMAPIWEKMPKLDSDSGRWLEENR